MLALQLLSALAIPQGVAVVLRGGAPPTPTYFWAAKNGDETRTGASNFVAPSVLEGGPSWSFVEPFGGVVSAAPMIDAHKNIYIATRTGNIYKKSPDGENLWTYRVAAPSLTDKMGSGGQRLNCIPSIMDGKLFAADAYGKVFALDLETGNEVWTVQQGSLEQSDSWSMTAAEGVVLVHDRNSMIWARSAADGSKLWSYQAKALYNAMFSVKDGSVGFSDSQGTAYHLDLHTGKEIWKVGTKHPNSFTTGGSILGSNGVMYMSSNTEMGPLGRDEVWYDEPHQNPGLVTAIDFATGKVLWERSLEKSVMNGGSIGHVGPGGSGRLALIFGIGGNPQIPWDTRHIVKKNRVVALDAETGDRLWTYEMPPFSGAAAGDNPLHSCLPDNFSNAAIGGDGVTYIGNQNGHIYAIQDKNGDGKIDANSAEVSSFDTKNAFQGSPAIAPDMLVIAPCNGLQVFKK